MIPTHSLTSWLNAHTYLLSLLCVCVCVITQSWCANWCKLGPKTFSTTLVYNNKRRHNTRFDSAPIVKTAQSVVRAVYAKNPQFISRSSFHSFYVSNLLDLKEGCRLKEENSFAVNWKPLNRWIEVGGGIILLCWNRNRYGYNRSIESVLSQLLCVVLLFFTCDDNLLNYNWLLISLAYCSIKLL